jgi:hypothetical protein
MDPAKAVHCTTVQPVFSWQSSSSRVLNAPEKASLHTLQYMGLACDVEYQRWFPERKSWWSPAWKERDGNTATILWLLTNLLQHMYTEYSNATSSEVTSHGQQMCWDSSEVTSHGQQMCWDFYHCTHILSDFFQLLLATISLNHSLNLLTQSTHTWVCKSP